MADIGTKKQLGQTGSRTVLQLQRADYKITLAYMGHDRVEYDEDDYRCAYELQRGESAIINPPQIIPNQVRSSDTHEDDDKAAKPYEDDGDNTNPRDDQVYRLMITDDHGMREADEADAQGGLLGRGGNPDGDAVSKPDNYEDTPDDKPDWMPDIKPVVPLRVVVRKVIGGVPVNLDKPVKVLWRIKDPLEEFDQNTGAPRDFLESFFAEYNRTQADPTEGDDNSPKPFDGIRDPEASDPGVKATDVLKVIPYSEPPPADTPDGNDPATVEFSDLTDATAEGSMAAVFELTEVEEDGVKIGVADVAFCPWPAFGDNYRFLLSVVDEGGDDIRMAEENGAQVRLLDDDDDEIPSPRAYTTGRIVLWKRMHIKLVVLGNRTQQADIAWNDVAQAYGRAFIEVVRPDATTGFFTLRPEQWIAELKEEFPAAADQTALDAIAAAPAPNDLNSVYGQFFFPAHLTNTYNYNRLSRAIPNIARSVIEHACDNVTPILLHPGSTVGKWQDHEVRDADSAGFFIFLVRGLGPTAPPAPHPIGNLLGSSFGDRMFWFANTAVHPGSNTALTTDTLVHEMGHAQYLRHSHTSGSIGGVGGDQANWFAAGAAASVPLLLFDSRKNNQILDHDQADAFDCTMSYTAVSARKPPFCGMCSLTLRFYDRVAIQGEDEYQEEIMEAQDPTAIVQATIAGAVWTLREPAAGADGVPKLPDLRVGRTMLLLCVGKKFNMYETTTRTAEARVNLTCCADDPSSLWTPSGAGAVDRAMLQHNGVDTHLQITGRTAGEVTLTFNKSGLQATAKIDIRP